MPKRRETASTPAGNTDVETKYLIRVQQDYIVKDGMIVGSGEVVRQYDLNDENIRVDMLRSFIQVSDEISAISWCQRFGKPVNRVSMPMLIQAAQALSWQTDLLELIRDEDHFQLADYMHSIRYEAEGTLFLNSLKTSNWESAPWAKALKKAGGFWDYCAEVNSKKNNGDHLSLSDSEFLKIQEEHKQNCDRFLFYTFLRNGQRPKFHTVSSDTLMEVNFTFLTFLKSEFEKKKRESALIATKEYLRQAVNWMLAGIQPSVNWISSADHSAWILEPTFVVNTPWQAMAITFQKQICGAFDYNFCKNKRCRKLIAGRSDRKFCGDACRKYDKRNSQQHL